MKIRAEAGRPLMMDAAAYRLPETLGAPPCEVRAALDKAFERIEPIIADSRMAQSGVAHSLHALASEGLPMFPGYGVLSGLAQNGMIRAGVEMRAEEMTRKWGEWVGGEQERLDALEVDTRKYRIRDYLNHAVKMCGYYGGCLLYIDCGEDTYANPLVVSPETFERGRFRGLKLIEPYLVTPGAYNASNPLAPDYYEPSVWYIQGIPVHATRLLYFAENELPSVLRPAYNFFGLSLSQKVLDAVSHFTECRESAARLLQKYSLTVFKTDMADILDGGMAQELDRRIKYFVQTRNNDGCAAIDKEREDLVVMTTSLAGVTDVVRQAMEYVAAMFCEPVTKMWGLSPNGFSTGDSDLRNHYDNVQSMQERMFSDPMRRISRILQMNRFGDFDNAIEFKFAPLSEDDEQARAATNKTRAETDAILVDTGAIAPEDVRQRLIDDPNSGYSGLEPYTSPEAFVPVEPDEREEVTVV